MKNGKHRQKLHNLEQKLSSALDKGDTVRAEKIRLAIARCRRCHEQQQALVTRQTDPSERPDFYGTLHWF